LYSGAKNTYQQFRDNKVNKWKLKISYS
jgi:hypothetical protein